MDYLKMAQENLDLARKAQAMNSAFRDQLVEMTEHLVEGDKRRAFDLMVLTRIPADDRVPLNANRDIQILYAAAYLSCQIFEKLTCTDLSRLSWKVRATV